MSTMFDSVEEAKGFIAMKAGVNPTTLEEVEGLHIGGMETILLDNPAVSEEIKQEIRARIDAQKGFKFKTSDGKEVRIVIGPFRNGFDCWIIGDNGTAIRI
jgi:hypothetical protein